MSKCLITGCGLVDNMNNRAVHGDLHRVCGDDTCFYVFNAVLGNDGDVAWSNKASLNPNYRQVMVDMSKDVFVRRGVIVFAYEYAKFNEAALRHLRAYDDGEWV